MLHIWTVSSESFLCLDRESTPSDLAHLLPQTSLGTLHLVPSTKSRAPEVSVRSTRLWKFGVQSTQAVSLTLPGFPQSPSAPSRLRCVPVPLGRTWLSEKNSRRALVLMPVLSLELGSSNF